MRSDEDNFTNRGYQRVHNDAFEFAKEELACIGIEFGVDQKFITVDELPGDVLSMVEGGKLFVVEALFAKPAREIATELLTRYVDLHVSTYDLEGAVRLLAPFVLKQAEGLAEAERLVAEDAAWRVADLDKDPASEVVEAAGVEEAF